MSDYKQRFEKFISDFDYATDTGELDIYTDFPELYEAFYKNHYNYSGIVELIEKYSELNEDSIIVEGACGTGNLLQELDDKPYNTFGFDLSPEMLSIASKNTDATLFRSDLVDFYLPYDIQTLVVLGNSLYHLNKQERKAFFEQAYKNMANRSTLIFSYIDSNEINDGQSESVCYTINDLKIRRNSVSVQRGQNIKLNFSFRITNESKTEMKPIQMGVALDGFAHNPKEIDSELKNAGFKNITITKTEESTNHTITIARKIS